MSVAEERSSRGSNGRFGREGGVAGSRMERCRIRGEIGFRHQKDSSSAKPRRCKDGKLWKRLWVGRGGVLKELIRDCLTFHHEIGDKVFF